MATAVAQKKEARIFESLFLEAFWPPPACGRGVWGRAPRLDATLVAQKKTLQGLFFLSHLADLNCRPARYECAALPTELKWLLNFGLQK